MQRQQQKMWNYPPILGGGEGPLESVSEWAAEGKCFLRELPPQFWSFLSPPPILGGGKKGKKRFIDFYRHTDKEYFKPKYVKKETEEILF